MRKFLLSLLMLAFITPLTLRADEIIVGTATGTPTATFPFRNTAEHSFSQTIYDKSEVGGAATITAVAYNCATPTYSTSSHVKIYIGESDITKHTNSSDWMKEQDMKLVFEGDVTIGGEEWENFTFSTPYEYSGTKNLIISVSSVNSVNQASLNLKWNVQTMPDQVIMRTKDVSTYPTTEIGSMSGNRPVIKLTTAGDNGGGTTPDQPGDDDDNNPGLPTTLAAPVVTATALSATEIELEWEAVMADTVTYQVYWEDEDYPIHVTKETSYTVPNCYPETMHCFTVVAELGNLKSQPSAPACATTPAEDDDDNQGGNDNTGGGDNTGDGDNTGGGDNEPEQPGSTSVSFFYNFNDKDLNKRLEGWNNIDKDGDGSVWKTARLNWYAGIDTDLEDNYSLYSEALVQGNVKNPDNYCITKNKYNITETSEFSFFYRELDSELYQENLSVVISEDGENFTPIWTKKFTEQDIHESGVWSKDSISLAAYAGKSLHIGFRHHDCNGETARGIKVDNVKLSTDDADVEEEEQPGDNDQPQLPTEGAETITIGENGTVSSFYVPTYISSLLGASQQIYTAEEIGGIDGTVVSLSFKTEEGANHERKIAVYLKNTDKEYYTDGYDWVTLTSEDVAVFEGTITTPAPSNWVTINFQKPFEYTGDNLVVTINDLTGNYSYSGVPKWSSYVTENPRAIYYTSYNEDIDVLKLDTKSGNFNSGADKYMNSQIKIGIVPAKANLEAPETIALGDVVLGEYWSEKTTTDVSLKAVNTTITDIKVDNDFFVLNKDVELPAEHVALSVTYNKNAQAGDYTANLTVSYADTTRVISLTATAYTATTPDVFELAQEVTFTENAYTNTPAFTDLHDNYLLPQEKEDGKAPEAVYEVELTDEALVTASVTGTNAYLAVYTSDFNGEDGPSDNNYYDGILYTPKNFTFDFNDGLKGWILKDFDGDNYNWEVVEEDGNKYVRSYSSKTQGEGEKEITIVKEANNLMMTESAYNITANSKLSFDAFRYGIGDESFDNSESWKEYIKVEVSKDGETFTLVDRVLPAVIDFENIVINLGAKFAELGLRYGDYHIALRHEKDGGMFVNVDNVRLVNEITSKSATKSLDAVHFPAGKYYFIAAAESQFTFNISTKDVPLTPPTEIALEEVTETSLTLSWNKVVKAEGYNIYRGNNKLATVTETKYTADKLQPYTEYRFVIKSYAGEEESFASEEIVVKTKDLSLTVPTNLVAKALNESQVLLTWDKVENALSYNVYLISDHAEFVATSLEPTYTVKGLEAATQYCFAVTAVRNETETEKSKEACATTVDLLPSAPTGLKANTIDGTTIGLQWVAGANALSYNVYRGGELVGNSEGTSYVDRNLTQGTEYCYTVKGVRNGVESTESSNEACATTAGTAPVAPVAPANLKAEAIDDASIKLTWNAVGNATSYKVYQDTTNIATVELPTYTVKGLQKGTEYCFTVTAVNVVGESAKSNEACLKLGESIDELATAFDIYPNPVNDELFIATELQVEEIAIYDVYGRMTKVYSLQSTDFVHSVNVADLNSGIYFVKIATSEGEIVKRFVKK